MQHCNNFFIAIALRRNAIALILFNTIAVFLEQILQETEISETGGLRARARTERASEKAKM